MTKIWQISENKNLENFLSHQLELFCRLFILQKQMRKQIVQNDFMASSRLSTNCYTDFLLNRKTHTIYIKKLYSQPWRKFDNSKFNVHISIVKVSRSYFWIGHFHTLEQKLMDFFSWDGISHKKPLSLVLWASKLKNCFGV